MRAIPAWLVVLWLAGAAPAWGQVEVQARVDRSTLAVGESATLEVVVRGAAGGISDPRFDVPPGLEILGSGRVQNFSWVNGRSTTETIFRYELGPTAAGRFTLGPIRVRVGGQVYQSATLTLSVGAADRRVGPSGSGPASLTVDVSPRDPYLGQAVTMRVRLVQRAPLAEDPQYAPPSTPGFWAGDASRPESYYADEGSERVLVTETRSRIYPLAPGTATVGPAVANLALATAGLDPLQWLRGRSARRELTLRSEPVRVNVRPLPAGAPPGFEGAVGAFSVTWGADRDRTARDVPATVWLELRGVGNLPLIHAPRLESADFEVFASTVDDSLPTAGGEGAGRRRFQWTVLARRQGRLELAAPPVAWFDPAVRRYLTAAPPPIALEVGPAIRVGDGEAEGFPAVFSDHPLEPGALPAMPWGWALAGLALAGSIVLWRAAGRAPADQAERARQREWLRAVGLAAGPDFWRAAEEASAWLERRAMPVRHLRADIAAARYGKGGVEADAVRRRVVEQLARALPAARPRWPLRLGAGGLGAAAVALAVLLGPHGGEERGALRARAADDAARAGHVDRARAGWLALWREGARSPALAARLAWVEVNAGAAGPAAVWVLRGELGEPRDPALAWVRERVREAGGLAGPGTARLPLRHLEWAILALALGAGAGLAWPRRTPALGLVALAIAASAVYPLQAWLAAHPDREVVRVATTLEGPGLELEAGQVVTVLERGMDRARVRAGRGVTGWIPLDDLDPVREQP